MTAQYRYCIVIPVHGRQKDVEIVLEGLKHSVDAFDGDVSVEARLIFDGDESGYAFFCDRSSALPFPLHCHLIPNSGPSVARNHGAVVSDADVIAFLDSDILVDPGYVSAMVRHFELHPDTQVLRGAVRADPPRPSRWHRALVRGVFVANDGLEWFYSSANLAWKREALLAVGGFDPAFRMPSCEDLDLCWRWILREGGAVEFCPEMLIVHPTTRMPPLGALREFRRKRYDVLLATRFTLKYIEVYKYQWAQFVVLACIGGGCAWIGAKQAMFLVPFGLLGVAYGFRKVSDSAENLRYTVLERLGGVLALPMLPLAYALNFLEGAVSLVLLRPSNLFGRHGRWNRAASVGDIGVPRHLEKSHCHDVG